MATNEINYGLPVPAAIGTAAATLGLSRLAPVAWGFASVSALPAAAFTGLTTLFWLVTEPFQKDIHGRYASSSDTVKNTVDMALYASRAVGSVGLSYLVASKVAASAGVFFLPAAPLLVAGVVAGASGLAGIAIYNSLQNKTAAGSV